MTTTRRTASKATVRGLAQAQTRRPYALAALIVFAVEVLIALFVHDRFIRPYLGDALVIGLVYLAVRGVTPLRVLPAVALAVAIAFTVEFAQAFNLIDVLGLRGNAFARTVLGSAYDLKDFAAYAAGGMGVLAIEAVRKVRML